MKTALLGLATASLAAFTVLGAGFLLRRSLITEQRAIRSAWSEADAALLRRAELAPKLINVVRGSFKRESALLKQVEDSRTALLDARTLDSKIAANAAFEYALGRVLVAVENYPHLKSSESFRQVEDELAGAENQIALTRRKYNEAVQRYNTDIKLFPKNVVARFFGFMPHEYFRADAALGPVAAPK